MPDYKFSDNEYDRANEASEISISGQVSRIIHPNVDEDFYIFAIKKAGTLEDIKVKGYCLNIEVGMNVDCTGKIEKNEKYGDTFSASSIVEFIPSTLEGIRKALNAGFVKGLTPENITTLLDMFGSKLFKIAETRPEQLKEAKGISIGKIQNLVNTVNEKRAMPKIMAYLGEIGLIRGLAFKAYREFGAGAVRVIQANPYSLMRLPKIGFRKSDEIARTLGIKPTDKIRLIACMEAVVRRDSDMGSTLMPIENLYNQMAKELGFNDKPMDINYVVNVVDPILRAGGRVELVEIRDEEYVCTAQNLEAETRIAKKIISLHSDPKGHRISNVNLDRYFVGLSKDPTQEQAVQRSLSSNFSVVTGGPGCGKTTILKIIVQVMKERKLRVALAAPTGRAAQRIKEATGFEGLTVHRLLGSNGEDGFEFNAENHLPYDAVVIDESSLLDTALTDALCAALAPGTKVVLQGDKDQIRSIGAGKVLSDIIDSGAVDVSILTEPHRTAKGSALTMNAHQIRKGIVPVESSNGDFDMYSYSDEKDQIRAILWKYKELKKHGFAPEEIQVLTPMRRSTALGSNNLNRILKHVLNPVGNRPFVTRRKIDHEVTFSAGDRVMQVENNKELKIFNGDIGYIKEIGRDFVRIDFGSEMVRMKHAQMDMVDLAFAATMHKTIGCEFKAVIMPICAKHQGMIDRNILYTGYTRGKKHVSLIGDIHLLADMVKKDNGMNRKTGLIECIRKAKHQAENRAQMMNRMKPSHGYR